MVLLLMLMLLLLVMLLLVLLLQNLQLQLAESFDLNFVGGWPVLWCILLFKFALTGLAFTSTLAHLTLLSLLLLVLLFMGIWH